MSNVPNYPGQKRDELLYESFKRKYDEEIATTTKLDDKANNLIGFTSIVVGLLMTEGTFKISGLLKNAHLEGMLIFYLVSVGVLLSSIGTGLYAFKVRKWKNAPRLSNLTDIYANDSYEQALANINYELAESTKKNSDNNLKKSQSLKISWYLLFTGLAMIFIFIVILASMTGINISGT